MLFGEMTSLMEAKIGSFVRYFLVTGLSFITNLGLTVFLTEALTLPEEVSFAIALITVFVMNFLFMRHYIYLSQEGSAIRQFIIYTFSAIGFRGLEYSAFLILHSWLGIQYAVAIIEIQLCSSLFKFFYYKVAVFRGKRAIDRAIDC